MKISFLTEMTENLIKQREQALQDLEGPLEPVFYATQPQHLWVADSRLALEAKPKKVSVKDFCAQENFTWASAPLLCQKRRHRLMGTPSKIYFSPSALDYWHRGNSEFVIVNLDSNDTELLKVGKGVFYLPKQNQPLKMGTCVGIYSGEVSSSYEKNTFHSYGFQAGQNESPANVFYQLYGTAFYNADNVGNETRLFQHAITEEELDQIDMPDHLRALVMTANLLTCCDVNSPIPTLNFITKRQINPGEQYLYPYGKKYWQDIYQTGKGSGSYALFDMDAEIIGTVDLEGQFTRNDRYQPEGKKPAPRCDITASQTAIKALQDSNRIDRNYAEIFLANIRFILELHANRKKEDNSPFYTREELGYLNKMRNIAKLSDTEKVLHKIDDIREELSKFNLLLSLSSELNGFMLYYQQYRNSIKRESELSKSKPKVSLKQPAFAQLDKPTINAIYQSLKTATNNTTWKIDGEQNFCLVGKKNTLQNFETYFRKQSIDCTLTPFNKTQDFCLRVAAARLQNKQLKQLSTAALASGNNKKGPHPN